MIYLLGLSKMLDINLEDELVAKIEKNRERKSTFVKWHIGKGGELA